MKKYIVYYRVSTKRQGDSGLGLDAQRKQVSEFIRSRSAEILDEFTEIESGTIDDRPELKKALDAAALYRVPLLIAKLDRLSRSAAFLMTLQESGVQFTCADLPDCCDMTVGVMALVARQERKALSDRTKAALAQAKERGVELGGKRPGQRPPNAIERERSVISRRAGTKRRAERYRAQVLTALSEGCVNASDVARWLTAHEVPTQRGGDRWQSTQVLRIMKLLEIKFPGAQIP